MRYGLRPPDVFGARTTFTSTRRGSTYELSDSQAEGIWVPAAVFERDGDLVVDRFSYDVTTGREKTERWIARDGRVRKTEYSVRFYSYTELRSLLLDVGFSSVDGVEHDGKPMTLESRRMIVIATR